jgi:hypothetical protein
LFHAKAQRHEGLHLFCAFVTLREIDGLPRAFGARNDGKWQRAKTATGAGSA